MVYYIEVILIVFLCCVSNLKKSNLKYQRFATVLAMFIAWLVLSMRGSEIGTDTAGYITTFYRLKEMNVSRIFLSTLPQNGGVFEIGFYLLVKGISLFTNNAQIMLAVSGAIFLFFSYKFLVSLGMQTPLFVLWYICLAPYLSSFNLVRQAIAVGLCLFSWTVYEKNRTKSLLFICIASTFHISAFIWLIIIIIKRIPANKKSLLGFLVIDVALCLGGGALFYWLISFNSVYQYRYGSQGAYADMTVDAGGAQILWIILIICSIVIAIKNKWTSTKSKYVFEIIVYSLFAVTFWYLGGRIGGIQRLSMYFQPFWVPLLVEFSKCIGKKYRAVYFLSVTLCSLIFFFLQCRTAQYSPYTFFFSN